MILVATTVNCDSELCGAGLRDGPAGGVDAIQLANAREARVGHGLVIGERGFLVVGRVVETARADLIKALLKEIILEI